ncbi:MAG: HEAT repeat domain-containing protein [Planctomycetes bacterium]|nr:HEAT repeat domain-containing protein [Planctomycetota bacterium]
MACFGGALSANAQAAEFREQEDLAELEAHGISPDVEGVRAFLEPAGPSDEDVKLARLWAAQLGSEKFDVREAASAKLQAMGLDALPAVESAAKSDDAEIRARARGLQMRLGKLKEKRDSVLPAVLRTIVRKRLKGLAPQLLKVAPDVNGYAAQENLRRALWTTVTTDDVQLLHKALGDVSPLKCQAAILALPAAMGEQARDKLLSLLGDDDPEIHLTAAQAAASLAPPEALSALIEGLQAEDLPVRMTAIRILGDLTGQRFGYAAYASPERRAAAVDRWKTWLAQDTRDPLRQPLAETPLPMGRLLLCHSEPFGVTELDERGRVVMTLTHQVDAPSACAITSEGWRVIGDWGSQALMAFDRQGREAWRLSLPGMPNSLERTAEGDWLTGLFDEMEIRRVSQDGETVWKAATEGKPSDAHLLPGGNVLACLYTTKTVVEINPEGKVVWRIEDLPPPESARRLANGNTLVSSSLSKVFEYAPDGEIVWSYTNNVPLAYDAMELPGGNVLIGYRRGLREVTRAGETVRETPLATVRRICAY